MSMVCHSNYLSLLSFKSVLWCSVHKFFTSWEAFVLPCLGPLETGMGDGLVKTVNIPSLPSEPTLWLLVLQELWTMPFTTAYKWAPYWEFSLNLSVHLTIGMFTSTLPMPGLGSRAPGIPTYDWSHQGIKLSTTEKNLKRQLVAFSFSLELGELNFPV